ncbi:glycosyltransferase family 4 protein [Anaerocolumna chitinilytica]|uniref:Glycosyl transferase n=1 Tax=Anaerocolumna chitinilytica TaxID=1727145 RepID=A0A7I8DQX4_9FIRM|nr:glycosyltransferase family 4 protein [Anaerocolumna chitinilytica]BCK00821.1 glycosyl transferase [Anaerocolumna chitinilytica]
MQDKSVIFLRSNPVDPDSRVEKEVNTLIKAGFSVTILAWDRSNKYKIKKFELQLRDGLATIYRFGIPSIYGSGFKDNLFPLFNFQLELFSWLFKNKNEYKIIHACDFDTAFVSYICAKIFNKKFIYDIFDYYVDAFHVPGKIKKIIEKLDHKIINSSDGVIICSEKRKEQILGTKPNNLTIIHNSPDLLQNNCNSLNLDISKIKVVYVGILSENRFLKELSDVIIEKSNCELHIGGFGLLEDYFEEKSKKFKNIKYYGKLSYDKTLELEYNCDIITAIYDPSIKNHKYAAPNKFYEALMLGKPIIMVKNTGMDDIVLENGIGEVIDYNIDSLKYHLDKLISYNKEWANISKKMTDIYNNQYSWNKMEMRLDDLYSKII